MFQIMSLWLLFYMPWLKSKSPAQVSLPCFRPIKPMTPLIYLLGYTEDSNQTPSASLASTANQIANSTKLYVINPSGISPYLWPRPWLKPSSLFGLKIISYLLAPPRLSPLHSPFNIVTRMVFLKPYRGITSGLKAFPIKAKGSSLTFSNGKNFLVRRTSAVGSQTHC